MNIQRRGYFESLTIRSFDMHNPKRPRKELDYYPIGPRKHPVSLLYDYCTMQNLKPTFSYCEIPQLMGVEYGCIVRIDNFTGEGRSFNKKTAKQAAAANLLGKLQQSNYFGEKERKPVRFVSEKGVVVVQYDDEPSSSQRSCMKSQKPSSSCAVKKRVQWVDNNVETDKKLSLSRIKKDRCSPPPSLDTQANEDPTLQSNDDFDDIDISQREEELDYEEDEENSPETRGASSINCAAEKLGKGEGAASRSEDTAHYTVVNDIEDYLAHRLQRTNIVEEPSTSIAQDSGDEIEVMAIKDVVIGSKRKRSGSPILKCPKKSMSLMSKIASREVNPVGFLQEACHSMSIPLAQFMVIKEHDHYKTVCVLGDFKTEGVGETPKESKKMAASSMISACGW